MYERRETLTAMPHFSFGVCPHHLRRTTKILYTTVTSNEINTHKAHTRLFETRQSPRGIDRSSLSFTYTRMTVRIPGSSSLQYSTHDRSTAATVGTYCGAPREHTDARVSSDTARTLPRMHIQHVRSFTCTGTSTHHQRARFVLHSAPPARSPKTGTADGCSIAAFCFQ